MSQVGVKKTIAKWSAPRARAERSVEALTTRPIYLSFLTLCPVFDPERATRVDCLLLLKAVIYRYVYVLDFYHQMHREGKDLMLLLPFHNTYSNTAERKVQSL